MKIAAVFLSTIVLLLNMLPCCWDECDEMEETTKTEKHADSKTSCSPFLSCGSCTGFILQQELPEISYFDLNLILQDDEQEKPFHSEFLTRIWQPPRL